MVRKLSTVEELSLESFVEQIKLGDDTAALVMIYWLEEKGFNIRPQQEHPAKPGETWMFHQVTRYIIGKVVRVTQNFVILANASWVINVGEEAEQALLTGKFAETLPLPKSAKVVVHLMAGNDDVGPLPYEASSVGSVE